MSDIFVSYASQDREKAKQLADALGAKGWSVWWDRTIPAGKDFDEVIEEAIDQAKCMIVLWSKASVSSRWVKTEAAEGANRNILIPVLVEEIKIPLAFRRLQAADLIGWDGDALSTQINKLVTDITLILGPSPTQEAQRKAVEEEETKRKAKEEKQQQEEVKAKYKTEKEGLHQKEVKTKHKGEQETHKNADEKGMTVQIAQRHPEKMNIASWRRVGWLILQISALWFLVFLLFELFFGRKYPDHFIMAMYTPIYFGELQLGRFMSVVFCFGLLGAGSIWLFVHWCYQSERYINILKSAGGWMMACAVASFLANNLHVFKYFIVSHLVLGAILGLTAGFVTITSLKAARIKFPKYYMYLSVGVWCICFLIAFSLLGFRVNSGYEQDMYPALYSLFSSFILQSFILPLAGISGFIVLAISAKVHGIGR